ncbi:MAG TPA: DOMON domain-containing protein [Thermotogota bacterium]|nr:DOMON domain-containing protein [Thermotogota bacterium]
MQKIFLILIMIISSISLFGANPTIEGTLDGQMEVYKHPSGTYELYWKVISEKDIYMAIRAKTTGWVAVGFSPSFMMKDADIKIANIVDGKVTLEDHYGTSATGHRQDKENEIKTFAGTESDGWTFVEFIMPLNTSQADDKAIKLGEKTKVIIAYSSSTDVLWRKHNFTGSVELVF